MPKSLANLRTFQKLQKHFKPVIEELYAKKIFGNGLKSNFQVFYDFLKFSEIFGNFQKNFRKLSIPPFQRGDR